MIQGPFMVLVLLLGCCCVVFVVEVKVHRNTLNHGQEVLTRSATGLELQEDARTEAA